MLYLFCLQYIIWGYKISSWIIIIIIKFLSSKLYQYQIKKSKHLYINNSKVPHSNKWSIKTIKLRDIVSNGPETTGSSSLLLEGVGSTGVLVGLVSS